jgi:pSer/pThr/pTyr-binding forkhead associated (FHA) protein
LLVRDLNSMNGIYVDDVRVQQTILRPQQIIQIGAIQLQIEESTEDEQPQEAMPHLKPKGNVDRTQAMKALRFELKRE